MLNPIVTGGPAGASARAVAEFASKIVTAAAIASRAGVRFPFRDMLASPIQIVRPTDTTISTADTIISRDYFGAISVNPGK
jgi:hypothetical protein